MTTLATESGQTTVDQQRDAFMERLLHSISGAVDVFSIYLGDQLGWYRALAEAGPQTSAELAARSASHERYAREWLEQQVVASTLRRYAEEAGFSRVEVLPIENYFFRFYQLYV